MIFYKQTNTFIISETLEVKAILIKIGVISKEPHLKSDNEYDP